MASIGRKPSHYIGSGLQSYVHSQARSRALGLIQEAKAEARRLVERARAEAEAECREIERNAVRTSEANQRRAVARAHLEAKQTLLQRREQCLESVWCQAESLLRTYGDDDESLRLALIERLIADAADQLSGGPLEVGVAQKDRQLLPDVTLRQLAERLEATYGVAGLTLSESMVPAWGGVMVRRTDSNQLVDNSLEGRLELTKRTLRDEVSRLLLPQRDSVENAT